MLITRAITFELVQPICPPYINVTDLRTDGQTDGRTTYDSNTALALRASRSKNLPYFGFGNLATLVVWRSFEEIGACRLQRRHRKSVWKKNSTQNIMAFCYTEGDHKQQKMRNRLGLTLRRLRESY